MHGLLSNQNIRIPIIKKSRGSPLPPALSYIWGDKGGTFKNCLRVIPLLLVLLTAVVKIPEGVVVGFQIFAWAPN